MRRQSTLSANTVLDLDAVALAAGAAWANARAEQLRSQRRPVAGGWPGTLSEARSCVIAAIAAGGTPAVSVDRLQILARAAYGAARTTWLAMSERDEED